MDLERMRFDMAESSGAGTVLIVEDEVEIRELMELHLLREGYQVTSVGSVEEALPALKAKKFHTLILDWMLPGASGVDLIQSLRKKNEAHQGILMVTAKADDADIVAGLDAGADDYMSKPFEISVLKARVKALVRRARVDEKKQPGELLTLGGIEINPATYEVKCDHQLLQLTPSEYKLLHAMVSQPGKVHTRDSLIEQVQGEGVAVVGRTVDTHIFGLRKKMGNCADLIETIRGIGYRVRSSDH